MRCRQFAATPRGGLQLAIWLVRPPLSANSIYYSSPAVESASERAASRSRRDLSARSRA